VAESDPACEYRETLDKARAMLEAVAQAQAVCAAAPALTEAGRR
jgi:anthranilate/para-aminobenzoate synthase component I